jgi:hypothetical protein
MYNEINSHLEYQTSAVLPLGNITGSTKFKQTKVLQGEAKLAKVNL